MSHFLEKFSLGAHDAHEFRTELMNTVSFIGGMPLVTVSPKTPRGSIRLNALSIYYKGEYVGAILDDSFHTSEGLYELLLDNDELNDRYSLRCPLNFIARFITIFQQSGDLEYALERTNEKYYASLED